MESETYTMEVEQNKVKPSSHVSKQVMARGAKAIRNLTAWNGAIDAITIRAYLVSKQGADLPTNASVEV